MDQSFTLSQLEYFLAVLKFGSFTSAADALGVSQPAVAEQIARLERIIGQSLFARQSRGVTPTRSAREFEPYARGVVDAAREASAWIHPDDAVGESSVAIGTFASPHHYGLADLLVKFLEENPGARLRVEGHNSSATADAVRAGELDAAVVALPAVRNKSQNAIVLADGFSCRTQLDDLASQPSLHLAQLLDPAHSH